MIEGTRNDDEIIRNMDESDFYSACEKQGIAVFYGMVQPSGSDVYIWKEDKGNDYDWLTKTAIRALVEKEYYHATS